jgi:hypothetical protein
MKISFMSVIGLENFFILLQRLEEVRACTDLSLELLQLFQRRSESVESCRLILGRSEVIAAQVGRERRCTRRPLSCVGNV